MTDRFRPILPGLNPDPTICRVGDEYVVATSSCEYFPGLPLYVSRDLRSWEPIGHAVDRPEQLNLGAAADSNGLWAPTLRHHDGVYYLSCTLQHTPATGFRSFYLTATDPRGAWSDPVWLDDATGIDPSLFFHDSTAWWTAARPARPSSWPHQGEIWLRELDLTAGRLVGPEHVIWRGSQLGARWTEAPHLYHRDGQFVLVTAEGGTDREHCAVVARSTSITGPYDNHFRNPILTHRHLGQDHPVQNVGHVDLVDDAAGRTYAVALGSRVVDGHCVVGRETFLVDVQWEDGWPVLAPDTGTVGAALPLPDRQEETRPSLAGWTTVRGPADFASETAAGVALRAPAGNASVDRPAALLRRLRSPWLDASVTLAFADDDAVGGMVLRRSDRFQIRAEVRPGEVVAIARAGGVDTVVGRQPRDNPTPGSTRSAQLTIELRGSRVRLLVDDTELAETDATILSAETEASFTGTLFGPYLAVGAAVLTRWSDQPLGNDTHP